MHFNVVQLMREPSGSSRTYRIHETLASAEGGPEHPVSGTVRFTRTDKGIWVSAMLDSEALCTCSRCLRECRQPIHLVIEEEGLPWEEALEEVGPAAAHLVGEMLAVDSNGILDIAEAVRQYSALNVPMKPVCSDTCAGICVKCGVDLNETTCDCDRNVRDHRWDALLALSPADDAAGRD